MRNAGTVAAVAALMLALAPAARADSPLTGMVVSEEGTPVAGLPVVIDNGATQTVGFTDETGRFTVMVPGGAGWRVVVPNAVAEPTAFDVGTDDAEIDAGTITIGQ